MTTETIYRIEYNRTGKSYWQKHSEYKAEETAKSLFQDVRTLNREAGYNDNFRLLKITRTETVEVLE